MSPAGLAAPEFCCPVAAAAKPSQYSSPLSSQPLSSFRGVFRALPRRDLYPPHPTPLHHNSSSFKVTAMESSYSPGYNNSGYNNSGYTPRRPRRDPLPSVSELDLQEQVARIDMDPNKMLQPGDPNTMQAIIRDVMPVGYFVNLPTGREGYLPAQDLGFNGGLAILQRLFKEGQEITVRIVCRGGAGREILSVKKPEFAPPSEQKTIESMRLHFENERKGANRPRRRR